MSCKGTILILQPPAAQPMALHAIPEGCVWCVSTIQLKLWDTTAVNALLAACHQMRHFAMNNEAALFLWLLSLWLDIDINEPAKMTLCMVQAMVWWAS